VHQQISQLGEVVFMRLPAVKAKVGLSRSCLYKLITEGKFPRPIPLGVGNVVVWPSNAIEAWMSERMRAAQGSERAAA
jgi:prophage regulatory protein